MVAELVCREHRAKALMGAITAPARPAIAAIPGRHIVNSTHIALSLALFNLDGTLTGHFGIPQNQAIEVTR
jgi:hypothetical protein